MQDYSKYDGLGLAELVRRKEVKPSELLEAAITRAEALNGKLNAIVHKAYDSARREAAGPLPDGPFKGVPFLIKDLGTPVKGMPRSDGTKLRDGQAPDTEDDFLVAKYRGAGVVLMGKTNTPEYGITGTTESQRLGPCRSPWNTNHITGGSSGGSASAVAAGIVPLAHASDGLGSIRIPAACCGLVGLKPSRGRIPLGPKHDGDMAQGYGVHHVVSRTVRDSAAMMDATDAFDPADPLPQPPKARPYTEEIKTKGPRLRVFFSDETPSGRQAHPEVKALMLETARALETLGHKVEEKALGIDYRRLYKASNAVGGGAFASAMRERVRLAGRDPDDPSLKDVFEPLTWRNWKGSEKAYSAADTWRGFQTIKSLGRDILQHWLTYDVFLCPVMILPPPEIGYIDPVRLDPRDVDKRQAEVFGYTPPFNMTGQPSISLPLGQSKSGLPIGMMFTGRIGDEAALFRLAAELEEAMPWKDRRPPNWM